MGRKANAKKEPSIEVPNLRDRSNRTPNWPLLALSLLGCALGWLPDMDRLGGQHRAGVRGGQRL
jgi:hypothetical protein